MTSTDPKEAAAKTEALDEELAAIAISPLEFVMLFECLQEMQIWRLKGVHTMGATRKRFCVTQPDVDALTKKMNWILNKVLKA